MIVNKKNIFKSNDNKRIEKSKPTSNEGTAAWQNSEANFKIDNVNKPSIESVVDAKDWVDNGSRL